MLTKAAISQSGDINHRKLKSEIDYRKKLQEICNQIHGAEDLNEILVDLKDDITGLFEAERLTVYVVDGKTRELVSRFKSGNETGEIRIPLSNASISGCSAFKKKLINIQNVYDKSELKSLDPELEFDQRWDIRGGFRTHQVLAVPIIFKNFLLGVIQLINRNGGGSFTRLDEQSAKEMAGILGIALYNQKRMAKTKPGKFDYFLQNHLLTRKELDRAVADARAGKASVESVLMSDFKISKQDIGRALSQFYNVPFVEYQSGLSVPEQLFANLKVAFMRKNVWVPLRMEDGKIVIAIDNPHDLRKIGEIKTLFSNRPISLRVALKKDILAFIQHGIRKEKTLASRSEILSRLKVPEVEINDEDSVLYEEDSAIVQFVNKVIIDAYRNGASDIHIEPYPGKTNTQIRIRVDGACRLFESIPYILRDKIVSRIKIMADLDIVYHRKIIKLIY